jgi:hypothetical protein
MEEKEKLILTDTLKNMEFGSRLKLDEVNSYVGYFEELVVKKGLKFLVPGKSALLLSSLELEWYRYGRRTRAARK